MQRTTWIGLWLGLVLGVLGLATTAQAATHTITTGGDTGGAVLRQTIQLAAPGDTINLQASVTITDSTLLINKNLTITGVGAKRTVARNNSAGAAEFRVLDVASPVTLTLSNLTIANGWGGPGGGVVVLGELQATNCTFTNNLATSSGGAIGNMGGEVNLVNCTLNSNGAVNTGGAIFTSGGTVNLTGCTINNCTAGEGGGVHNQGGTVTITSSTLRGNTAGSGGGLSSQGSTVLVRSTISGNTGTAVGGGILNNSSGTLSLTNCTVSGNQATGSFAASGGGAMALLGVNAVGVVIESCTITNNTAPNVAGGARGGIWQQSGPLSIANSIVAGNSTQDILRAGGTLTNGGHNFIGENTSVTTEFPDGMPNGTNWIGTEAAPLNPMLAPLGNNGGLTQTHELLSGSFAIDSGDSTQPTDQRGIPRPQNGADDIGAFEVQTRFIINGYIRTSNLAPIPGVSVQLSGKGGAIGSPVVTDANGLYAFSDLTPDAYNVTPTLAGWSFSPASQGLTVTTTNRSANFMGARTVATYQLSGRISNATGQALVGVSVALTPATGGTINPAVTNSAGYYTFTNLPDGTYTVTPSQSGTVFTPASRTVTLGAASRSGENFVGRTGHAISGRVATSSGIGISGVTVQVAGGPSATTNSAGYYTLYNVADGTRSLTASKTGYTFTPSPLNVTVSGADVSGRNFMGTVN